jgi:hypothetical protein
VPALKNTASNTSNMKVDAIRMEIEKLSQMQEAQSNILNNMDEQARNAIRHIKGG